MPVPAELRGLSSAEVLRSRAEYGANRFTPPAREPWWRKYLEKYDDPIIRVLLIAAGIAFAVGWFDGAYWESLGILLAVLLATTLAFLNEYRAEKEFDLLNRVSDQTPIKTLRDGQPLLVPLCDLVVGDLVHLETGDEAPADGRVVAAVGLSVDESRLTGESEPVAKTPTDSSAGSADSVAAAGSADAAYPADWIARGALIAQGHGWIRLEAVGDRTELGRTARTVQREHHAASPLEGQLERLSRVIGAVGFGISAVTLIALIVHGAAAGHLQLDRPQWFVAILGGASITVALARVWGPLALDGLGLLGARWRFAEFLRSDSLIGWLANILAGGLLLAAGLGMALAAGYLPTDWRLWLSPEAARRLLEYFMVAATIIVVAVPEGLAMSVTLCLAYSMRRMLAENNLVRRLSACETIGAATVICSDKTGTLTLNQMRVQEVLLAGENDFGSIPSLQPATTPPTPLLAEAIASNSTAQLSRAADRPASSLGNPTEGALLLWLDQHGHDYGLLRNRFPIAQQWAFSTERKLMGTLGRSSVLPGLVLHVKGAPEFVLGRCTQIVCDSKAAACDASTAAPSFGPLDAEQRQSIERKLAQAQADGRRTLAFAAGEIAEHEPSAEFDSLARNLVFLGFAAITDPVRPDAPRSLESCRQAGVKVKMVTGDNRITACEIARQVGLLTGDAHAQQIVSGEEFALLDDAAAQTAAEKLSVLYRARPLDKLRLVRLLQAAGEVVAVTGDGANDAAALKCANVGLAMGKSGVAVAKEASDIILLDDAFQSIVLGISWGRALYENIQRFLLFQLTINVTALCLAMLGPFLGVELPFTVAQMLWINLIMDTFAALALATERPHQSVMRRPPRDGKAFIVTPAIAWQIAGVSLLFLAVLVGLLLGFKQQGWIEEREASWGGTVLFTVFVMLQFWNLFHARCLGSNRSAFLRFTENRAFLGIAAAILVGQVIIVQYGGRIFRTQPLSMLELLVIVLATSPVLLVGEIYRLIMRRLHPLASATDSARNVNC